MNEVTEICTLWKVFSLDEVNKIVPLLNRITKKHETVIKRALDEQRFLLKTKAPQERITEKDDLVVKHMTEWSRKVFKLGATVFPGGYLGFDSGFGFWSWHYAESHIQYQHDYGVDAFSIPQVRRKLD